MAKKTRIRSVELTCKACGKTFYKHSYYPIYENKVAEWEETMKEEYTECKDCWAKRKKAEREAQPPTCAAYARTLINTYKFNVDVEDEEGATEEDREYYKDFMERLKTEKFSVYFAWSGNTFPVKDQIKATGASWNPCDYEWYVKGRLTPSQILKMLEKMKNAVDGAVVSEKSEELVRLCKKIVDFK